MLRAILLGTTATAVFSIGSAAIAQGTTGASQSEQAQAAGETREADSTGIADIVVTAQRRSESLQRAAIAATAVAGDTLINAGVSEPLQLTKLVPALTVQPAGLSSSFFIRGVGATAINSFQENAVAFSVGGVFYARPTAPAGTFYDLERIEVLKGPQGTLYGRNATGGAINLIPKQAVLGRFSGDLTAEYGNYDSKKVQGGLNIPIGESVAIRVSGQVIDRDGYRSDGYDDEVGQAARVSLLIKPSDSFSAVIAADYFHQGGKGVGAQLFASPVTPNVPNPSDHIGTADPRVTTILQDATFARFRSNPAFAGLTDAQVREVVTVPGRDGYQDSDFWGVSATFNGDMGFADLTSIFAYRKSKPNILTYAPGFPSRFVEDNDQITAEVRLASKPGPLRYVVGAFWFYEQQDSYNNFNQGAFSNTEYLPRLKTESAAVFGELTYSLTSTFRLVAGGRYTKENKLLAGFTRNRSFFLPSAPYVPVKGDLDFDKFTWKAGFEWDAGARSLIYGHAATGFKAGGFYPSAGTNTYKPETLTAFTLGSKNRFFDNSLQLNVEAFYWQYRDQQFSYVGPIEATPGNFAQAGVTVNVGKARMFGAEVELLFQPSRNDTLGATVQYLNSKYQSFEYEAISTSGAPLVTTCGVRNSSRTAAPPIRLFLVDCSGKQGVNAPEWTANLNYEHRFELNGGFEIALGARSRLETSSFLNLDFLDYQKRGAYSASDAYLTLTAPHGVWSLSGFVNNIEDRVVKAGGLTRPLINVSLLTVRPPRTFGIRGSVKF